MKNELTRTSEPGPGVISSFERDRKEGAVEHSFLLAHYLCTKARVYMHVSRCPLSALCAGPLSLMVRRLDFHE